MNFQYEIEQVEFLAWSVSWCCFKVGSVAVIIIILNSISYFAGYETQRKWKNWKQLGSIQQLLFHCYKIWLNYTRRNILQDADHLKTGPLECCMQQRNLCFFDNRHAHLLPAVWGPLCLLSSICFIRNIFYYTLRNSVCHFWRFPSIPHPYNVFEGRSMAKDEETVQTKRTS